MRIQLRGTIRAALHTSAVQVDVPVDGLPLSDLLEALALSHPRARRYLRDDQGRAVLRVIHNGVVVAPPADPLVHPDDEVLLMHAVAGGSGAVAQ